MTSLNSNVHPALSGLLSCIFGSNPSLVIYRRQLELLLVERNTFFSFCSVTTVRWIFPPHVDWIFVTLTIPQQQLTLSPS